MLSRKVASWVDGNGFLVGLTDTSMLRSWQYPGTTPPPATPADGSLVGWPLPSPPPLGVPVGSDVLPGPPLAVAVDVGSAVPGPDSDIPVPRRSAPSALDSSLSAHARDPRNSAISTATSSNARRRQYVADGSRPTGRSSGSTSPP